MNEHHTSGPTDAHSGSHAECSEVLHRIYEYLDGEMHPSDVARVAQHLEACGPCLHEHDLDRAVKAAVRRSNSAEQPCPDQLKRAGSTRSRPGSRPTRS